MFAARGVIDLLEGEESVFIIFIAMVDDFLIMIDFDFPNAPVNELVRE